MLQLAYLLILIYVKVTSLAALRMLFVQMPSPIMEGESVDLICSYQLEGKLYEMRWFKGTKEFYKYTYTDADPNPEKTSLTLPGVTVDLAQSGSQSVHLKNVDINSEGRYSCEVKEEGTHSTGRATKELKVLVLPSKSLNMTKLQLRYRVGDTLSVNCTSYESKPAAILQWFINDDLITEKGHYELQNFTLLKDNGLDTTILSLLFELNETHFRGGIMKLKCTGSIASTYTMSSEMLVLREQSSCPLLGDDKIYYFYATP